MVVMGRVEALVDTLLWSYRLSSSAVATSGLVKDD